MNHDQPHTARTVLLEGVVGSRAYGLDTADSDTDILGMFAYNTDDLLSLDTPADTITTKDPDATWHEARKFLRLVLDANPTQTELLWLPEYTISTPWAAALIANRAELTGATLMRRTYLGYATGQFRKLEQRGDGSFSSDTRKRTEKHARHLLRLLRQGYDLYATGRLTVRLDADDADYIRTFGKAVADGDLDLARTKLAFYESAFDARPSALPDKPNRDIANSWLLAVREDLYSGHVAPAWETR